MKKILILLVPLLLVGCSAKYTLTIDNNDYSEHIEIIPKNDEEKTILFSKEWAIPIDYKEYSETDDSDNNSKFNKDEYYEYNRGTNSIEFEHNFNFSKIVNSTALKKCFDSARIVKSENKVIITTDKNNTCFDDDGSIEKIDVTIIIKDKKVLSNNADKVIDNKYIWYIDTSNYNNKSINLTYEDNSNEDNNQSDTVKINLFNIYIDKELLIFCLVFFVIVGIVVLIYKKVQKDDE